MALEELLDEAKSFGWYQALMTAFVFGGKGLAGWSTMVMAFAGAAPSWYCSSVVADLDPQSDATSSTSSDLSSPFFGNLSKTCPDNASMTCSPVFFNDRNTIVSQWGLVCHLSWIPNVVTSVQMAGLLLGAVVSGHLGDVFGRKWTLFATLILHTGLNVVAGFSQSWQMFAAFRFLVGSLIGSILVLAFTFPVEFFGVKARSALPFIPAWPVGVGLFALSAWQLHDWSYLHFVLAAIHLPFIVAAFLFPESVRWLVTQGRLEEAERSLAVVARINRVPLPRNARQRLAKIVEEVREEDKAVKRVSYLDLVRHWTALKSTLVVSFSWCTLSLVYYGLAFSARSLAGNLYLNILLLNLMDLVGFIPTYLLNNRIGRRWTVAAWFFLMAAAAVGIILASLLAEGDTAALVVKVLALVSKAGVSSCWAAHQAFVSEIYPTRIRSLGYGWANTTARVGGIIAPFIINMDSQTRLVISYVVVGVLALLCGASNLTLAETKGKALLDTLANFQAPSGHKGEGRGSKTQHGGRQDLPGETTADGKVLPGEATANGKAVPGEKTGNGKGLAEQINEGFSGSGEIFSVRL